MTARTSQRKSKSSPEAASLVAVRLLQAVKRSRLAHEEVPGIAVAVSGGVDSMVLAEALHRTGVAFTVIHFDHRWRGTESGEDLKWVRKWATERNLPFVSGKATKPGVVGEGVAREQRWKFFFEAVQKKKLGQLWLAQHADDLVETFLLQLMRGAGPEGMASLRACRLKKGIRVVRPLLEFEKADLKQVAVSWGVEWHEDPTNQWMNQFRNRVRLRLLPYMEKVAGRPVKGPIWRAARVLADENEFWEEALPRKWPERPSVAVLRERPVAFQRRFIRGWLKFLKVSDINFDVIEAVRSLLNDAQKSKVNLAQDKHCRRRAGVLFIE
jgi:tRNA(Ile)-lysidine synthase